MKIKRLVKQNEKKAKKNAYKNELKALQKECGDNMVLYRSKKAKLQKRYGCAVQ